MSDEPKGVQQDGIADALACMDMEPGRGVGKAEAYIAVRRAGFDFEDGDVRQGEEYFDYASMSATEDWARDMAAAHGRLVSGPGFDANTVHPVVRVARVRIVEVLALLIALFASAASAGTFERPRWADLDGNGRDTRADVLAAQCGRVTWDAKGKRARQAECLDVYSGAIVATDAAASALQVDHLYPASIAWSRRAWRNADGSRCTEAPSCAEYVRFYNDTRNLIVTRSRTNNRKGARMPAGWCPALRGARLLAAKRMRAVAAVWALPFTAADERGLKAWAAGSCAQGAVVLGGAL